MKKYLIIIGITIILSSSNTFPQSFDFIPLGMSYQGILKASADDTVVSDGTHPMRFYIYDDSISGNLLWQQPPLGQGSQNVETVNGLFNVIFGSYNQTQNDLFMQIINDNPGDRWLEVEAYGELLSPRTRLFSTPYSYRSVVSDSSQKSVMSLYADSAQFSWNAQALDGLERESYVEEGEPDVIDGSMIVDGSIMNEDIGFSGFHEVFYTFANNSYSHACELNWQDIDSLSLNVDVAGDSTLIYLIMNMYYVTPPFRAVEIRIVVDGNEVIRDAIQLHYTTGSTINIYSPVNLNLILTLSNGPHIIKGQYRRVSPDYSTSFSGKDRNLIAIILR